MADPNPVAVRLGGFALLNSSPASWAFTSGVQPVVRTFDLDPRDMVTLLRGGADSATTGSSGGPRETLLIVRKDQSTSGTDLDVFRLFVLHSAPGSDPMIGRVTVADLRYWWPYEHVTRRYNVTRRVGVRRLASPDTPELQPVTDRIQYAPWSLKQDQDGAGSRWTAMDVLEDVLTEIGKRVPGGMSWRIDCQFPDALPIQNLELDDPGDAALQRVLNYLPGGAVTVEADGTVVVYSQAQTNEQPMIEAAGDESEGGGNVQFIRMASVRPKEVHVLFSREIEIRFDAEEAQSTGSTSETNRNSRTMQNVLPVTDHVLTLVSGETVCKGTWITFGDAFRAWGNAPGLGRPLDYQIVREMMVPYNDMFGPLELTGKASPDADWASRIAAVQEHFRRTYRINRRWMDRVFRLSPYRVAVIDPVTGTRSPAVAYSDRYYLASQRSMLVSATAGASLAYSVSVLGWPTSGVIDESSKPAATVSIVDGDQGIIHLDYVVDPGRMFEVVGPGQIEKRGDNTLPGVQSPHPGPTADISDKSVCPIFDGILDSDPLPYSLTGRHKVAVILSARPASPNNDGQLTRLVRKWEDVQKFLPGRAVAGSNAEANGPVMEVMVGAGVETARVAWVDANSGLIEQAFGINANGTEFGNVDLNSLTVNKGSDAIGANIDAIADAVAAKVYADFSDRSQGQKTVALNRDMRVIGWIDTVEHVVSQDGETETVISLPGRAPKLSMASFLPDSTRRMVFRLADGGRSA